MAFSRDELLAYEKKPQTQVSDKVNPFAGATPAKVATAAAIAAVQSGQNLDATPGGAAAAAAQDEPITDDAPIVDEEGTLGDPTDSGEGTSDETVDSSTTTDDPSVESEPNADLTGEPTEDEVAPAPKKGSAAERIVELNDLTEGYKVFGRHMQEQLKDALSEIERMKGGSTRAVPVVAQVVEKDEPMPDMGDPDVAFDNDKYRVKMAKWVKDQGRIEARRALREEQGATTAARVRNDVESKCEEFAKDHKDFKTVVTDNPVLAQNQLSPDAGIAVAQSEHTAELLYRFGKDPGMAIRVARQSPGQQCVTIGKMIAQIESEKTAKKATVKSATPQPGAKPGAKKSTTQAPPPPRPIAGGGRATARDVLDPNMSMDDFARQHRGGRQAERAQNRKQRGLS
jgi:hypothetical protein